MQRIKIIIIMSLIFVRCSSSPKDEYAKIVNNWIGKEIRLPEMEKRYNYQLANPNGLKIATRINGNCYSCLTQLKKWKIFVDSISSNYKIPFYIYIVIADSTIYEHINNKEIHFNYPVIFDSNNKFQKLNKLDTHYLFHTMLLDSTNKILLIGDPMANKKIQNLYENIINKQINKK